MICMAKPVSLGINSSIFLATAMWSDVGAVNAFGSDIASYQSMKITKALRKRKQLTLAQFNTQKFHVITFLFFALGHILALEECVTNQAVAADSQRQAHASAHQRLLCPYSRQANKQVCSFLSFILLRSWLGDVFVRVSVMKCLPLL